MSLSLAVRSSYPRNLRQKISFVRVRDEEMDVFELQEDIHFLGTVHE